MDNIAESVGNTLVDALNTLVAFLPALVAGLIILLIGWLIAAALRTLVSKGLQAINIRKLFRKAGVEKEESQDTWINVISQVVFWTILILFLVPVFEVWNIPQVNDLINQLILYLPRVFSAVIVAFLGFVVANLFSDVVGKAASNYGEGTSRVVSAVAYYSVIVFVGLIVLSQLGIAPELVQILFMGIVATVVLAAGLAFGLGGRDAARDILDQLMEKGKKAGGRGKVV
jgi:hypothetical protein